MRNNILCLLLLCAGSFISLAQGKHADFYTGKTYELYTISKETQLTLSRFPLKIEVIRDLVKDSARFRKDLNPLIQQLCNDLSKDGPHFQQALGQLQSVWPWFIADEQQGAQLWKQTQLEYTDANLEEIHVKLVSLVNNNWFFEVEYSFRPGDRRFNNTQLKISLPFWLPTDGNKILPWDAGLQKKHWDEIARVALPYLMEENALKEVDNKASKYEKAYDELPYPQRLTPSQEKLKAFFSSNAPDPKTWVDWSSARAVPCGWGIAIFFPQYSPSSLTFEVDRAGIFLPFSELNATLFKNTRLNHFFKLEARPTNISETRLTQTYFFYNTSPDHECINEIANRAKARKVDFVESHLSSRGDTNVVRHHYRKYNESGQLVEDKVTDKDDNFITKTEWDYDGDGRLVLEHRIGTSDEKKVIHDYNQQGNLVKTTSMSNYGSNWVSAAFNGQFAYVMSYNPEFEFPENRQIRVDGHDIILPEFTIHIDENGRCVGTSSRDYHGQNQIYRNDRGWKTEQYQDHDRSQTFWMYNEDSQLTETRFYRDNNLQLYLTWHYSDSGLLPDYVHEIHSQGGNTREEICRFIWE
ncbi:MAG: hypothetical protein ACPF8V_03700 [Luteibaculum sp.]